MPCRAGSGCRFRLLLLSLLAGFACNGVNLACFGFCPVLMIGYCKGVKIQIWGCFAGLVLFCGFWLWSGFGLCLLCRCPVWLWWSAVAWLVRCAVCRWRSASAVCGSCRGSGCGCSLPAVPAGCVLCPAVACRACWAFWAVSCGLVVFLVFWCLVLVCLPAGGFLLVCCRCSCGSWEGFGWCPAVAVLWWCVVSAGGFLVCVLKNG